MTDTEQPSAAPEDKSTCRFCGLPILRVGYGLPVAKTGVKIKRWEHANGLRTCITHSHKGTHTVATPGSD